MNNAKTFPKTASLTVTHVLAELLERLEHSAQPVGAEQYRSVVMHLVNELHEVESTTELHVLLDTHPAAAEVYENVNYRYAGLCRSPLDPGLAAEQQARQAIARAMQRPGALGSADSVSLQRP
jgi:hypothetical protein